MTTLRAVRAQAREQGTFIVPILVVIGFAVCLAACVAAMNIITAQDATLADAEHRNQLLEQVLRDWTRIVREGKGE